MGAVGRAGKSYVLILAGRSLGRNWYVCWITWSTNHSCLSRREPWTGPLRAHPSYGAATGVCFVLAQKDRNGPKSLIPRVVARPLAAHHRWAIEFLCTHPSRIATRFGFPRCAMKTTPFFTDQIFFLLLFSRHNRKRLIVARRHFSNCRQEVFASGMEILMRFQWP